MISRVDKKIMIMEIVSSFIMGFMLGGYLQKDYFVYDMITAFVYSYRWIFELVLMLLIITFFFLLITILFMIKKGVSHGRE